jgi:DNA-binding NarL/FixJ family response regulator
VSPRVLIAEDDVLLREGIERLLTEAGFEVVGQAGDADEFLRKALAHRPDVSVVDIEMPPGHGADGLRAALDLRARLPATAVLLLSNHYVEEYALDLIGDAQGVGYLLKQRIGDIEVFTEAVARVAAGGSALDPEVVRRMLGRRSGRSGPLDDLTDREREVLAQLAEGKSNRGIAEALVVTPAGVEKHVTSIFRKLEIENTPSQHRRVLATLRYLRELR